MIRLANEFDLDVLSSIDNHISNEELNILIKLNRVFIFELDNKIIGYLRYNLFWDNTPFLNMIYFFEEYRKKGYGKQLLQYYENEMKIKGYNNVLTSTQSDEEAQFFYRKLGYHDAGCLLIAKQPLEIILIKEIK